MVAKLKGILKKEGHKSKKRRLVFDNTIDYIQEFDEDLPVQCITDPKYEAPYDPNDDEGSITFWYEMEDEATPWQEEYNVRGYTWNDVSSNSQSQYRSDGDIDTMMAEFHDSWVEEVESDSDVEYEEMTLSDEDSDYGLDHDQPATGHQWDVAHMEAMKADTAPSPVNVKPEEKIAVNISDQAKLAVKKLSDCRGDKTPTAAKPKLQKPITEPKPKKQETNKPEKSTDEEKLVPEEESKLTRRMSRRASDQPLPKPTRERPKRANSRVSSLRSHPTERSDMDDSTQSDPGCSSHRTNKVFENKAEAETVPLRRHQSDTVALKCPHDSSQNQNKRPSDSNGKNLEAREVDGTDREDESGSQRSFSWEKPEWVKENKLKTTKKGRAVRKGANLAKPITMINRAKNDFMDAKLLNKPGWTKQDEVLKQTETGKVAKKGEYLSHKITHIMADEKAREKFGWQKPEWVGKRLVRETAEGEKVKKGEYLSSQITNIASDEKAQERFGWQKPDWAQKEVFMNETPEGAKLKKGEYLSRGITHINDDEDARKNLGFMKPEWTKQVSQRKSEIKKDSQGKTIEWEKPEWAQKKVLKNQTAEGTKLKKGEYLSRGITHINDDEQAMRDLGFKKPEWTKQVSERRALMDGGTGEIKKDSQGKVIEWEKPEWAKKKLVRETSAGQKLKQQGNLAKPITFPKGKT